MGPALRGGGGGVRAGDVGCASSPTTSAGVSPERRSSLPVRRRPARWRPSRAASARRPRARRARPAVERLFADPHREWARRSDPLHEGRDGVLQLVGRDDPVDESPVARGRSVDRFAREQQSRARACGPPPVRPAPSASSRRGRSSRRAWRSGFPPRRRRGRRRRRAGSRPRWRSRAPSRYRLRNAVDRFHQHRADVEQSIVELGVATDHLPKVVTGGKRGACALDHDCLHLRGRARLLKHRDQLLHQRERERVPLLRAVERDAGNRRLDADEKMLAGCGGHLRGQ